MSALIESLNIKFLKFIILVISSTITVELTSQTIYTEFGKNRVQFHDDFQDWWLYETDHYTIYWYGKERNLAKSVILLSQISYDDIEDILDYKMNKKVQVIVYASLSDLKQSNLGIKQTDDTDDPGLSLFYDNKVLVYFNGDHNDMLKQIREGTAKVFLHNMLGGLNYENIYKKLVISNFPKWFTTGSISFLADNWNFEDDEKLRQLFLTKKPEKMEFRYFSSKLPDLAGKSFFHFLHNNYSDSKMSDFFYLVRISRDIKSSLQSAFNKPVKTLYKEWQDYFYAMYESDKKNQLSSPNTVKKIKTNNFPVTGVSVSENKKLYSYITNRKGRAELFLNNGQSTKRILKLGYVNTEQETDMSYPISFFSRSGSLLYVIFEKKDALILRSVNTEDLKYEDHIISPEYRRIYSASPINENELLLNADVDGFNDLFIYNLKKRQSSRLTEDFWDDLDAKAVKMNGKQGAVFASNRSIFTSARQIFDTIVPLGKFDIFFYDFNDNTISNLTSTPEIDERNPDIYDNNLYFTSDVSGIRNIELKDISSTGNSKFITSSETGIINYDIGDNRLIYSTSELCNNNLNNIDYPLNTLSSLSVTGFRKSLNEPLKSEKQDNQGEFNPDGIEIDEGLFFQSKFIEEDLIIKMKTPDIENTSTTGKKEVRFAPFESYKAIASRLKFSFSELITRVDNEPLFDGLETYNNTRNSFVQTIPGFLVKTAIQDMFEDHHIETGFRISTDFKQKEYFWVYENLKSRIDWQFGYYRKSRSEYDFSRTNIVDKSRLITNLGQIQAKYSFDVYRSLKLIARIHSEKTIIGASDTFSLNLPGVTEQRLSLRSEYVFDNTSMISANLPEGNRSKVFVEGFNRFNLNISDLTKFDLSKSLMLVLGFDSRQYFRVFDRSIAAFRLAGQKSLGSEKNLYLLGGMENWYFAKQSDIVSYPESDEFAYKILAANMRGFGYNARNGSSFLLFSSELRIPVFHYLFGQDIRRSFLRNFQLNFFYDMGLAWIGKSPFSEDNPSNYKILDVPPSIKLKVRYYSDPLIAGFGAGVRTTLVGYFIKFDYAWGIETRIIQKPVLYFSVGYDF